MTFSCSPQPPSSLPIYVQNVLESVAHETGYTLAFQIDPLVPYTPHLHVGSTRHPLHLLRLAPDDVEHQTHLTLSALHKIQRLCGAPPRERLIGVPKAFLLPTEDHLELGSLFPNLHAKILEQVSEGMALSLVAQLVEMPIDIRVEREIALSWPEHRTLQQEYLRSRVEQLDFIYNPRQKSVAPTHSLGTLRQINGAHPEECMQISGSPVRSRIARTPESSL